MRIFISMCKVLFLDGGATNEYVDLAFCLNQVIASSIFLNKKKQKKQKKENITTY